MFLIHPGLGSSISSHSKGLLNMTQLNLKEVPFWTQPAQAEVCNKIMNTIDIDILRGGEASEGPRVPAKGHVVLEIGGNQGPSGKIFLNL